MTGRDDPEEVATMAETTFLPVPREPLGVASLKLPDADWLDGLQPGSGAGIHTVRGMRWTVGKVIADLESGRPGGAEWKQAMAADAAAVLADKPPKVWAVEKLLAGDAGRWSHASAQARTSIQRRDALIAKVREFPGLAASARSRLASEVEALARHAEEAYRAASTRSQDDRAEAWQAFAAAKGHREEAARCRALLDWIANGGRFEPEAFIGACYATPQTAGYYLAAEGLLEGRKRISVPGTTGVMDDRGKPVKVVEFPANYDPFTAQVTAATERELQARLAPRPGREEYPAIA
jgi:hypothetical protein